MLSKVLAVVQSKAALAVLGVVLVAGGGTAVYAATGHQLPVSGTHADATAKPDTAHTGDNHGHTVSIEGVLKGYDAKGGTISVQSKGSKSATTVKVNDKTRVEGDPAHKLADLSNNIGHRVEVQANKQSNGTLIAWKVTVQGDGSEASSHSHTNSSNGQRHALRNTSRVSA